MPLLDLLQNLKNKSAIVLGAGLSGIAACRLLAVKEAKVTLVDDSNLEIIKENIRQRGGIPSQVQIKQGISNKVLENAALIILSPGIPLSHPAITLAKKEK
ncbi:MAG: hypothetical protein O2897_06465, partial [bacterium]|nr:hypothetical protein [bacterium]